MKKKQIVATLTAVLCCMGTFSAPGMAIVSAAEQAQSYVAQENFIDNFKATVETYMNDNNINGTVYTEGFKASDKILVEVMSDSDAQLVKNFIETEGNGAFYIDFTHLGEGRGIRILAAEETLMNIRGNVSRFIEENNIIGYTYISADSNVITVVCNSNEDIELIKAYVAEKCYRAERLEYTLPDFEVNAPDIAPTDLEEIRKILGDFIKQNGISGYTKIAPRKGENKVWVMLDSVKDENYRKIELFMTLYGIDSDSVIIDSETSLATEDTEVDSSEITSEPVIVDNSEDSIEQPVVESAEDTSEPVEDEISEGKEELLMNVRADIEGFIIENNIKGYTYDKHGSDIIMIVCNTNEEIEQVKAFVANKGYRTDKLEYTLPDFEVNAPDIVPTDLEEIRQILDDFIKQNDLNGYTIIRPRKGEDKVWVMLDSVKDENYRKIELFMDLYGIDSDSVIIDGEVTNASEPVVVEHSDDKDEPIMHVAASISTFMEENSIEGYIYQKQDSEVLVIVCKTNDGISQVKSFVADKGYRTDRLEYTLPDFEVNPPAQLSGNLEDYRQVIDEFIKQNGISGYTKIADYKGEEKIWVILDTLTDEYTRKIEFFIAQYGIDKNSVIIDTEVINPTQSDTNNKNIASDDELAQWAIKDYQDKTGFTAASAEVKPISDDKYEIVLKDADGNILDTYTINPETGIGTNSSNDAVDLPQTGMSGAHKAIAGLAALMTLTGVALIAKSRRKDEDQ